MAKIKLFSRKIRVFAFVLAVVLSTAFVVYSFASAANTTIGNNISTSGTLTVGGASTLSSTLLVSGRVNSSSTLQTTGDVHFYGNLTVDGTTNISGLSFSTATVTGNLYVGGDASIAGGDINLGTGLATSTLTSSGGNLGIGTTSPSQLLAVQGNVFFSGNITNVANITATGTLTVSGTASSSIATALGIASTSPWGTFSVEIGTVNPAFVVSNNGSTTPALWISGVNQNGYVGIGTSTPDQALTVIGSISNNLATSSAAKIQLRGSSSVGGSGPTSVFVAGRYAYVTLETSNLLQIFDVSTSSPALIGSVATDQLPQDVYVAGRYAYVTNYTSATLQIFDVAIPNNPTLIGSVSTNAQPFRIQVVGKLAFVGHFGSSATVEIFDISNPKQPTKISVYTTPNSAIIQGFHVVGNYLYTADNSCTNPCGFRKVDITDPFNPVVTGFGGGGASNNDVYVSGNYAYVAQISKLNIFNISSSTPSLVGSVATDNTPQSIKVSGRYAYVVTANGNTLQIFDVSDPTNPFLVSRNSTNTGPYDVFVAGRYVYVANYNSGNGTTLQVFDTTGIETTSAIIHSLEAGSLQVRNDILAYGQLSVFGGINVGPGGILSNGALAISSTSTPSAFLGSVAVGTSTPYEARFTIWGAGTGSGPAFRVVNNASTTNFLIQDNGGFISSASSTVAGPLQIAGVLQASTTLSVTGISTLASLANLQGGFISSASSTIADALQVSGPLNASSTLSVAQKLNVSTSSPSQQVNLAVEGGALISGTTTVGGLISTSTALLATQGGNVGVGTSSPRSKLQVVFGPSGVLPNATADTVAIESNTTMGLSLLAPLANTSSILFGSPTDARGAGIGRPASVSNSLAFFAGDFSEKMRLVASGRLGIGTTTPSQLLSVHGNTLISGDIINVANITATGTLTVLHASTTGMLTVGTGFISSASSTVAGSLQIASVLNASSTLTVAGLESQYGGFISQASSTVANTLQIAGNLQASSTVSANTLFVVGNTGIGTTSPAKLLSVQGNAILSGDLQLAGIRATGSIGIGTATPYARLAIQASVGDATRLVSVASSSGDTYFEISSTGTTTIDQLQTGALTFDTNAGVITWIDMPITSSAAFGVAQSYSAMIDASTTLTIYGQSDGAGGVTNQRVGIGTTSPWGMFSVEKTTASTSVPIFVVSSMSTGTPYFIIANNGYVGIGTTSPGFPLSVFGNIGVMSCIKGATTSQSSIFGPGDCSDIAESYFAGETLEPGDLVALADDSPIRLVKATNNSKLILGVISAHPAVLFEGSISSFGAPNVQDQYLTGEKAPLALTGRILVKVNLEGGEIKAGDPITASSESGIGQKATSTGMIVGYALTDFTGITEENRGMMTIIISLGDWQAPVSKEKGGDNGLLAQVIALVKQWLESMKIFVEDGLVKLKNLVAEKITTKELELQDKATGDIYCVSIVNGELEKTLGACSTESPAPTP